MTGVWLFLAKCIILFYAIGIVLLLIAGIVKMAVAYAQDREKEPEKEESGPDRERLSERDIENLKYAKGLLNDMRGIKTRDEEIVKSNGYSYYAGDIRELIQTIDKIIWEEEREQRRRSRK